jgi:hypothetical protein
MITYKKNSVMFQKALQLCITDLLLRNFLHYLYKDFVRCKPVLIKRLDGNLQSVLNKDVLFIYNIEPSFASNVVQSKSSARQKNTEYGRFLCCSAVWTGISLPMFQRSLLLPSSTTIALMMEAVQTSETSVNLYQSTRRYNPEDGHLHSHRPENLKSYLEKKMIEIIDRAV